MTFFPIKSLFEGTLFQRINEDERCLLIEFIQDWKEKISIYDLKFPRVCDISETSRFQAFDCRKT